MKHLKLILQTAFLALALLLPGVVLAQWSPPSNFQVISGPSENFLSWTPSYEDNYQTIARGTTSGGPYTEIAGPLDSNLENYTDNAMTNGVEYYYVVTDVFVGDTNVNSAEEAAIPLTSGGYYTIVNGLSGLALTSSNGVAVQASFTGATNQFWKLASLGGANFALLNQGSGGLTLTGPTASSQLTVSGFTSNSEWYFQVTNGADFLVFNLGSGQVLDDFNASLANGSPVGQWTPDGSANQDWAVAQPAAPALTDVTLTNNGLASQYTFSGQVNPNGLPTTVICSVGTSPSYSVNVTNVIPAASAQQSFTYTIPYPVNNATIHGQVTVQNEIGSNSSDDLTFLVGPPQIQSATVISDYQFPQATVSGQINLNNLPTTVILQFGTNTSYGQAVTNTLIANQPVSASFGYPSQGVATTLHAFITASNVAGTVTSGDLTCSSLLFEETYGQSFGSGTRNLAPLTGSAAWADLDNDGWLDLVIEGQSQYLITAGGFYYNPGTNQTAWTPVEAPASGNLAAIGVGDFDNDNRPDLFLACGPQIFDDRFTPSSTGFWQGSCVIQYGVDGKYNNSTNLAPLLSSAVIPNLSLQGASVAVGDFDHTGREEAMVSGNLSFTNRSALEYGTRISMLYRNNNFSERTTTNSGVNPAIGDFSSTLEPVVTSLPFVGDAGEPDEGQSALVAGDFDNDGFADLFALNFQIDSTFEPYAGFFHGDGNNNFTLTTNTFRLYPNWPGDEGSLLESASCVLADMNGDGNLDMVLSYCDQPEIFAGYVGGSTVSVWLNDGHGNLTNSNIVLPQLGLPNIAVGDIFNHGRNDILMVGYANQNYVDYADEQPPIETVVLRNDGNGVFTPIVLGYFGCLGETGHGLQLADYDNDGRLDFVMTGDTAPVTGAGGGHAPFIAATVIFRNEMNIPSNAPPAAPPNLSTTVGDGSVTFHWNNATDDVTPANLLTYNLRVGTNSLGTQTVSPVANVITGWRKMVGPGNCGHTTNTLYHFPPGTYYWSVQAVDGGFKGGAWAPEQTFTITNPEVPVLTLGTAPSLPAYVSVIYPTETKAGQDAINLVALTLLEASTNEMNIAGNTLNLSWPIRYQGWTVEQTTNLVNPVWTTNTTSIGTLNGEWSVLLTNTNTMFYRLAQ